MKVYSFDHRSTKPVGTFGLFGNYFIFWGGNCVEIRGVETVVETEDATFSTHDAWREAWRQFTRNTRIKGEIAQAFARLMDSRGKPPPDLSRYSKHIAPLGVFTESGQIRWNKELEEEIIKLGTAPPISRTQDADKSHDPRERARPSRRATPTAPDIPPTQATPTRPRSGQHTPLTPTPTPPKPNP